MTKPFVPRLWGCVVAVLLTLVWGPDVTTAQGESVRDGYKRPTFTMPYAWTKPTLDGSVGEAEWDQALRVTALQTTQGRISPRQTTFRLCWDEETLYVAMQSPLRPGERPIQALRRRGPERNVVFDDSYEIFLDVGTHTDDGQPCFFQFLANFAGARHDILHLPAVGNSRIGWSSGWEPVNRLTTDNVWEWEMAIPRTSVFRVEPLTDGQEITMLLARDFKRPWEQNSVEGTSSFSVLATHSRYRLSKSAPAVHLDSVASPDDERIGLELSAWSRTDGAIQWSFESDSGIRRSGTLQLRGGERAAIEPLTHLDSPGEGGFRIRVKAADAETTYLDWSAYRTFGKQPESLPADRGDVVQLSLALNPVKDYLRVDGDFVNYDARDMLEAFRVEVKGGDGALVASCPLNLDKLAYVSGVLRLPGLKPGPYMARLECLDGGGNVVLQEEKEFTKKDPSQAFPWWKTHWGNIERVIAPWTPVEAEPGSVSVWGRTMSVGAAGLPAQIRSQGRDLLARPVRLELTMADGSNCVADGGAAKLLSTAAHRAIYDVSSRLGPLVGVHSVVTVEFDGMYRVELTVTPEAVTRVASLRMIVPLRESEVDLYHACARGVRYGFDYGAIPEGTGRLWDCRKVGANPMQVGSFVPYVFVGRPDAGLCWYADSDAGWIPNDDVPAFELLRAATGPEPGSVDLVFNLISRDVVLEGPRTLVFAFQATPVKALHHGWRMDSWWCGDTFLDWQFLGQHGGDQIWTNIPFTLEEDACREKANARHKETNTFIFGDQAVQRSNAVPYLEWKSLSPRFAPEVEYFGEQWKTSISDGLCFEETLSNFLVYHAGTWAKTCGIDGFYLDNSRPQACDNVDAGCGYVLPDGRIQPTYNIFPVRRLLLRLRAAFLEANGRSTFVLHTTNNFIAPWLGAVDIAYDGEHHVIYPEMGTDFMDYWKPDRMRLIVPTQWGVAVNFMHEYQGPWEYRRQTEVMRAYTGAVMLFDGLPSGNANGLNTPVWTARARFGIDADDVEYIGPWRSEQAGLHQDRPTIYLAAWQRPGKVLVAVVNYGDEADSELVLGADTLALASPALWRVSDAEEGTALRPARDPKTGEQISGWRWDDEGPIHHDGKGIITVPVKHHSYRLVLIETQ